MKLFFSLLLCFFAAQGMAHECRFKVDGEFLYMISAIDQPYYYMTQGLDPNTIIGERIPNNQTWHAGYRLEASYRYNCLDTIRARWTHFPSFTNKASIDGAGFAVFTDPFEIAPGSLQTGSFREEFKLYTLDVFYEREFYSVCPFFLSFEAGVQFAHIDMNEEYRYASTVEFVGETQSKVRGVGPEVGIDMHYSFLRGFDLQGRVLGALLVSKKDAKLQAVQRDPGFSLVGSTKNTDYWLTTPTLDIRFGIGYNNSLAWKCLSGTLNFELGYEFIHYMNGVNRIFDIFDGTNDSTSITQQMDLTLHGPYIQIGIRF